MQMCTLQPIAFGLVQIPVLWNVNLPLLNSAQDSPLPTAPIPRDRHSLPTLFLSTDTRLIVLPTRHTPLCYHGYLLYLSKHQAYIWFYLLQCGVWHLLFFVAVYSLKRLRKSGFYTLTIHYCKRRYGWLSLIQTTFFNKYLKNLFKSIQSIPTTKIVVHQLPFGVLNWKHPPLTSCFHDKENGIQDEKNVNVPLPFWEWNYSIYVRFIWLLLNR